MDAVGSCSRVLVSFGTKSVEYLGSVTIELSQLSFLVY